MRSWIAFVIGGALGFAAGAGGMLIAFPFLFPPPVLSEAAPEKAASAGTFQFDVTAPGRDAVHWANGSGTVYRADGRTIIRFENDFEAGPGPNFWVYLNTVPVGEEAAFNADAGRLKLAPLKAFTGSQNYALQTDVDLSKFRTVTIWCESFSVYIASAALPGA